MTVTFLSYGTPILASVSHFRRKWCSSFWASCKVTVVVSSCGPKQNSAYNIFSFIFIWPCLIKNFFIIEPTDALISKFILVQTLHVSGSFSAHHQEFPTVHSALAHVIQVWRQLACRIRMELQFFSGVSILMFPLPVGIDKYECKKMSELF